MKKLSKLLIGLACIAVILVIAVVVAVKMYLTEERLQAMIGPPTEKALGRQIALGGIDVGIFSGITVTDFAIKEADGKTDFISTSSFVLRYDLAPLLSRKLVINEISLINPTIHVQRNKDGAFNFQSLAVLRKKSPPEPAAKAPPAAEASPQIPLTITVENITIQEATFTLLDETGELPAIAAKTDVHITVALGGGGAISFRGKAKFTAEAAFEKVKARLDGSAAFDQQNLDFNFIAALDDERLNIKGKVGDYMKAPAITLDILSDRMNLDNLFASVQDIVPPQDSQKQQPGPKPAETKPAGPLAERLPKGFSAIGKVLVKEATFKKVKVTDFTVDYGLDKGILTVSNLSAKSMGGILESNLKADLNHPDLSYDGSLGLHAIQLSEITSDVGKQLREILSGSLETSLSISGSGMDWDTLKNRLDASGKFILQDGQVKSSALTDSIAALLGLNELKSFNFEDISGMVNMHDGKAKIDSRLSSSIVSSDIKGIIGLDGSLDLPITLELSESLTAKLQKQADFTKYLAGDKGTTTLSMKLTGNISNPKPTLDSSAVKKQVTETVKNKALDYLSKELSEKKGADGKKKTGSDTEEAAKELLKGLFK